jgi:glycosyltransferase involved in cell wall biosynthesis
LITKKSPRILALIPAYNEERYVTEVVKGASVFLPVLVVDDGSKDDTAFKAGSAGAEVLLQMPNKGKGSALREGFRLALAQGYDAVITLDADGQHNPNEIPVFIQEFIARQPDLIIGQRDFSIMPTVRKMSNTIGTHLFSWAVKQAIPDNQCGYRLVSRRLMLELLEPAEQGYEFEVEMIVKCIQYHFALDWVPVSTIYGDEISHISPLKHGYKFVQVSLRARKTLSKARKVRVQKSEISSQNKSETVLLQPK